MSSSAELTSYYADVPHEDRRLQWLALMQHHGAPTRLLDFTRSFYVASFFAFADADETESSHVAIYAVNEGLTRAQLPNLFPEYFESQAFPLRETERWFDNNFRYPGVSGAPPVLAAVVEPLARKPQARRTAGDVPMLGESGAHARRESVRDVRSARRGRSAN